MASVVAACHHLAVTVLSGETATSLRRRYYEAKRDTEAASTARALALLESRPLGPALVALLMKAVLRGRLPGGSSRHGKGWHYAPGCDISQAVPDAETSASPCGNPG